MDVFDLDRRVVEQYGTFARSFTRIRAADIKAQIHAAYATRRFWPEPILQINPHYQTGDSMAVLVTEGVLAAKTAAFFSDDGAPLQLYRHQVQAIRAAQQGRSFVVTTGTGSGKSLCYFIPIADRVFRARGNGGGKRTRAIVIYPMNALANSQLAELDRYAHAASDKITFARYTGQEADDVRKKIAANPPDILLTNFMMLELLLTRQEELDRQVIGNCQGLEFLVLDELHTYRGRQGADVAMLVRRVRERLGVGDSLQCIGTSATMASEGGARKSSEVTAEVASRLFATEVAASDVITESLRRATDPNASRQSVKPLLAAAIAAGVDPNSDDTALAGLHLAIWVETVLGVERASDNDPKLKRAMPRTMEEAAAMLAADAGVDPAEAREALEAFLAVASCSERQRTGAGSERPFFPFRLHQFISGAGVALATLEPAGRRMVTLDLQQFAPERPEGTLLFPVHFCRSCGQEHHPVRLINSAGLVRFEARSIDEAPPPDDDNDGDVEVGFLMPEPADGDFTFEGRPEDFPDEWQELTRGGEIRLKSTYRKIQPRLHVIAPTGHSDPAGQRCWFSPGKFRLCLACLETHAGQGRDINRLASLSAEGRSSATTMLVSSVLRWFNGPDRGVERSKRKILGFTDNRQDAALQAGHFNDFLFVSLLRASVLTAIRDCGKEGLDPAEAGRRLQKALGFFAHQGGRREHWMLDPDLQGFGTEEAEKALRLVLANRFWVDQQRGWRFTNPSLEQLGLVKARYRDLDEVAANDGLFDGSPILTSVSAQKRQAALELLLEHMRRGLAIQTEDLEPASLQVTAANSRQYLRHPWAFPAEERPTEGKILVLDPPADMRPKDAVRVLRGGPRTKFGRALRAAPIWGRTLKPDEGLEVVRCLLAVARRRGYVVQAPPPFKDVEAWRLAPAGVRFVEGDGQGELGRDNPFFKDLYRTLADLLTGQGGEALFGLEGREHTAQVEPARRQYRESRFRFESKEDQEALARHRAESPTDPEAPAFLPALFCSPTMELGVDISALNVVYMRNAPPTPANYVQRSGRAGRSGQPALVLTYCAALSPHDQYYFRDPRALVQGIIRPPTLDLANHDLVKSHLNAVWLASTETSLSKDIAGVLDIAAPDMPVEGDLAANLQAGAVAARAEASMGRVLDMLADELSPDRAPWAADRGDLARTSAAGAFAAFGKAFGRWRDQLSAAITQREQADKVLSDRTVRDPAKRAAAEQMRRQAEQQYNLLIAGQSANNSDYYTYRYLATEGFLPGYNFPRLPLQAFIPASRDGSRGQAYLQRARFLGISEYGPRSIIYHEGRSHRVVRVLLGANTRAEDGQIATKTVFICGACGAGYWTEPRPDLCVSCGESLAGADVIRSVLRIETVSTVPAERITANDEDRQRQGFELQTTFEWPTREQRLDVLRGDLLDGPEKIAAFTYGAGVTLTRLNLGLNRRRQRMDRGFWLDPMQGWWRKLDEDEDGDPDPATPHSVKVVPAVEDHKNALLFTLLPRPTAIQVFATVQHALVRGAEQIFQLEEGELLAEPEPSRQTRRSLLFYEATEGGAGVLSEIARDPGCIAAIARKALEVMHYRPPADLSSLSADEVLETNQDEKCVAGCYRCLLSYYNQPDHDLIDRKNSEAIHTLLGLARATAVARAAAPTPAAGGLAAALATLGLAPPDETRGADSEVLIWKERYLALAPREFDAGPLRDKGLDVVIYDAGEPAQAIHARLAPHFGPTVDA